MHMQYQDCKLLLGRSELSSDLLIQKSYLSIRTPISIWNFIYLLCFFLCFRTIHFLLIWRSLNFVVIFCCIRLCKHIYSKNFCQFSNVAASPIMLSVKGSVIKGISYWMWPLSHDISLTFNLISYGDTFYLSAASKSDLPINCSELCQDINSQVSSWLTSAVHREAEKLTSNWQHFFKASPDLSNAGRTLSWSFIEKNFYMRF